MKVQVTLQQVVDILRNHPEIERKETNPYSVDK